MNALTESSFVFRDANQLLEALFCNSKTRRAFAVAAFCRMLIEHGRRKPIE
jgi:hypothetical protein